MAAHGTTSGDAVKGGARGKHGAANQGVKSGSVKGRAKNPATAKVQQDGRNAQGGGPGGGQ